MGTSMLTVRGIVDPPKLIEHIKKQLGKHAEFVRQEEEIGRGKGKDKDKDKEKSEDNSTCNITNKICPEVEIRFQYPPQYSVDHIYPCQMFSDENPLACSMM